MRTPSDQIIHKTAWLYYGQGLRQEAIAEALGISRGSVVNYLKRAKDVGAVSIRLPTGIFREDVLARRLEDAMGLKNIWIIPDGTDGTPFDYSVAAGQIILDQVKAGDKIGLAWGETLYYVVENMPTTDLEGISVLQMCGNLGAFGEYRPDQCTVELAIRFRATAENIYAPLVLHDPALAATLRAEPIIASQFERLKACNVALFSAGSCMPDSHVVACGAMTKEVLADHVKLGAAAMVVGRMIDKDGNELDCAYNDGVIAMDLDTLRAIPNRICFADRGEKAASLSAACRGGFVTRAVITTSVAKQLEQTFL